MLITGIALVGGLAVVGFLVFVAMCLGIRRDDRLGRLDGPAPGPSAMLARSFTGLRVQLPESQCCAGNRGRSTAGERARADA